MLRDKLRMWLWAPLFHLLSLQPLDIWIIHELIKFEDKSTYILVITTMFHKTKMWYCYHTNRFGTDLRRLCVAITTEMCRDCDRHRRRSYLVAIYDVYPCRRICDAHLSLCSHLIATPTPSQFLCFPSTLRRGFRRICDAHPSLCSQYFFWFYFHCHRNCDGSGSKTKKKILALLFNPPPLSNLVAR